MLNEEFENLVRQISDNMERENANKDKELDVNVSCELTNLGMMTDVAEYRKAYEIIKQIGSIQIRVAMKAYFLRYIVEKETGRSSLVQRDEADIDGDILDSIMEIAMYNDASMFIEALETIEKADEGRIRSDMKEMYFKYLDDVCELLDDAYGD